MKESLSTQYKKLFHEELLPYGFKLYKKTFYRAINDIMQTVMLCKTSTNFTVEFDIHPLSIPIKDLYCEGYDISVLEKRGSWDCWPEVEEGAFEDIMLLFRRYVKPLFEQGTDSKSAYDELIKLEKMIYTGVPGGIVSHYSLACLCIQSQNYKQAYQHMSVIVERWDEAFHFRISELNEEGLSQERKISFEKFMCEYQEIKEVFYKLSVPDVEYFQKVVAKNKAISLESLKHPRYPGKHK